MKGKASERELWRRYKQEGDMEARAELIRRYMPLVRQHAEMTVGRFMANISVHDLEACGYIGLIQAVEAYDPARGVRFSTFSKKRIVGAMIDMLRAGGWIGRGERARRKRVARVFKEMCARLGSNRVDMERLAREAGVSVEEAIRYTSTGCMVLSFEDLASQYEDGEVLSVADVIEDKDAVSPYEVAEVKDLLEAALSELDDEERKIVEWAHRDGLTLKEIARRIRRPVSQAATMHRRALHKARRFLMRQMRSG